MGYRNYAAALMFVGFAFAAAPVIGFGADARAQGYAGVLPAESTGSSDDKGALPFMSSQMGKQESGGHANVTGGAESGDDKALGGYEIEDNGDGQAAADTGADLDGDGEPDAPDPSDVYGLNGDTTLSTDDQSETTGKTGYMAMIGGDDNKSPKQIDIGNDPTPENLYRAMEGGDKNDSERARLRLNRELDAARAAHNKEIDAMNAARMRDHQVRAQGEIDRVLSIQQEAMAKVREAQGTATLEDYELGDGGEPQENTEDTVYATDGTEGELVNDDTGAE